MIEISWKEAKRMQTDHGAIVVRDIYGADFLMFGDEIFRISPQPADNPEYEQSIK